MGAQATTKALAGVTARLRSPIVTSLAGKTLELITLVSLVTVVPRLLGTADYGRFALATSVVAIASSSVGLGGPTLLSRFIPAAEPELQSGLAYTLLRRLIGLRALQMLVIATIGVILVLVAPELASAAEIALVVLAITLDVGATLAFQTALAFGRTSLWSFRWPMQNVLLLGLLPPLYYAADVLGAIAALPFAAAIVLLIAALSIRGRVAPPALPLPPGIIRFGFLSAVNSVFTQLRQRGGVLAVALLGPSSIETGFAALAINIGLAATYAVNQIFTVELPRLSRGLASDPEGQVASARSLSTKLTLVVIPAATACVLVVDEVIPRLAGQGFAAGAQAIAPALAAVPFTPLNALVAQLAALKLFPGLRLISNVLGAAAFVVVAVVAVPAWAATGGSAALLAGVAVSATIGTILFRREIGLQRLGLALAGSGTVLVVGLVS